MKLYSKTYFANTDDSRMSDAMNPLNLYSCGRESLVASAPIGPYDENYYLIFIGENGRALYRINEEIIELGMNRMCLVGPGEEFWVDIDSKEPWNFMWIGFNGNQAHAITEKIGFSRESRLVTLDSIDEVAAEVNSILEINQITHASDMKRGGGMFKALGAMMENSVNEDVRKEAAEIKYVNEAVRIISKHYAEKIKITDIADNVGINRSYLSNLFRQVMSMSPQEFLISYRLDKAALMLNETEETVGNIAAAVGYADPLAFSKAFKQKFGVSPRSYRNNQ